MDIGTESFNKVILTFNLNYYIGSFGLLDPSLFKLDQILGRVRPLIDPFDRSSGPLIDPFDC